MEVSKTSRPGPNPGGPAGMSEVGWESSREQVKALMEAAVADLEQTGKGNKYGKKCYEDATRAIEVLRRVGIGRKFDIILRIEGPLKHYNFALGGVVEASNHEVAELDQAWIADIAMPPGQRIFYDIGDYLQRSGIEIPQVEYNRLTSESGRYADLVLG